MTAVRLVRAGKDKKELLHRLMQLYQYDFTEFDGNDPDANGVFRYKYLKYYWIEPDRIPFLIYCGRRVAGFVLVNGQSAILDQNPACRAIAEFFVMRKFRRRGVGRRAAMMLFNRLPGPWEIQQTGSNKVAQTFWRKVIRAYTRGKYSNRILNDRRWRGPIQNFTS